MVGCRYQFESNYHKYIMRYRAFNMFNDFASAQEATDSDLRPPRLVSIQ